MRALKALTGATVCAAVLGACAGAAVTVSPSRSVSTVSPAAPTVGPSLSLGTVGTSIVTTPRVVGSIPECWEYQDPIAAEKGRVYWPCGSSVVVFDLASNRVVQSLDRVHSVILERPDPNDPGFIMPEHSDLVVLDGVGGLWVASMQITLGTMSTSRFFAAHVRISTGEVLGTLEGELLASWGDAIYLDDPANPGSFAVHRKADGEPLDYWAGPSPESRAYLDKDRIACGQILSSRESWPNRKIVFNWGAPGAWPKGTSEPGYLIQVAEIQGRCWGLFQDSLGSASRYHLARLGARGFDARSPEITSQIVVTGGVLWLRQGSSDVRSWQHLSSDSWKPTGRIWTLPSECAGPPVVAGDSVWCSGTDSAGTDSYFLTDIPLAGQ